VSSVDLRLPYLRIGSGGPHVRSVQEQVQRLNFLSGGVDGIFGQQTDQAVRVFQRGWKIRAGSAGRARASGRGDLRLLLGGGGRIRRGATWQRAELIL